MRRLSHSLALSPVALALGLPCVVATAVVGLGGCSESRSESRREGMPPVGAAGQSPERAGQAAPGQPATVGERGELTPGVAAQAPSSASGAPPAPAYDGPYFGATVFHAAVMSDMEWPPAEGSHRKSNVQRLGYIRHGQKAPVLPEAHKKDNCKEGWYELVAGGFVCGRYGTLDLNHPRFKVGHPPDLAAALPYTYAMNGYHGTPLYRQVPPREERVKYEPWLSTRKARVVSRPASAAPDPDWSDPYATSDAGLPALPSLPPPSSHAEPGPPPGEDTPWYMRDYDGGATPTVTLNELREEGGLVAKRMVKGFYLSVDKKFEATDKSMWWKLNDGLVAPIDRVWAAKAASDYHGVWMAGPLAPPLAPPAPTAEQDGGAPPAMTVRVDKLPVGFITSKTAHKWNMADSHKHATQGGALHRWIAVRLTNAEPVTISGTEYFQTEEGWWMRGLDGTKTEPGPPPEKLGVNEKWVDVNLKRQTLVAFEGDKPVFATLVSSGRGGHETPPGTFRIREKHIASTMDADGETAADGPYSIQDVPYIQYFNAGYALHGAFWHSDFGHVKSHGCVNLAPLDAKALFSWTEPQLPDGWHGVNQTHTKPGSRVVVHY